MTDQYQLSDEVLLDVPITISDEDSIIQKYYRLVRFLSAPLLLISALLSFVVWEMFTSWAFWAFLVGMPVNFLLIHWGFSKYLAYKDSKRLDLRRMVITPQFIIADMPDGKREFFEYRHIENLKIIFSGIESKIFTRGSNYNGAKNELTFKYNGRKVSLHFRLPTQSDYVSLQDVLMYWGRSGYIFDEYNSTSGLPITSYMLEVR